MRMMAHLEVREDAVVVQFDGDVDMAVADEFASDLKAALEAASTQPMRPLIIDLQAVTFFGSSGLNGLVTCHDEGAGSGIAVALVTSSPVVIRVIQATRLDEILAVYPTVEAALSIDRGVKSA